MKHFLLVILIWCGAIQTASSQAQELLDSLQNEYEIAETDSMRCYWLYRLAWVNIRDNSERSEEYTNQAIEIAKAIPDSGIYYKGLYYHGLINRLRGSYDTSLYFLGEALAFYDRQGAEMASTGPLFNIAVVNSYLGNYDVSIEYYMRELAINEKHGKESSVANSLNSIGIINRKLERYEQALADYEKALEIFTRLDMQWDMANVISNKGNVFSDQGNDADAERMYQRALEIDREIEDNWGSAYNLHALGLLKLRQDSAQLARQFLEEGLELRRVIGQQREIAESLSGLASAELTLGELDDAERHASEALEISEEIEALQEQIDGHIMLADIYAEQGQYQGAYEHQVSLAMLNDSLFSEEKVKISSDLLEKYESEKKDRELAENDLEIAQGDAKIKNQQLFLVIIISAAVALGLILLYVYRNARNKQRLQDEQLRVAQRDQELMSVKAMIAGEEQERSRIARELHDGLSGMLAAVKLQFGGLQKKAPIEGFDDAMNSLDGASTEIRRIAHNMMPEMLMKYGLVEALNEFLSTINASGVLKVEFQHYGMDSKLENSTELVIYRIIQELLNNIIKHSGANEALIQMNRMEDMLSITVEDNGKGFNTEKLDQDGLGMTNLKSRVDYLNGELNIQSDEGMGTSVYIEFTLKKEEAI